MLQMRLACAPESAAGFAKTYKSESTPPRIPAANFDLKGFQTRYSVFVEEPSSFAAFSTEIPRQLSAHGNVICQGRPTLLAVYRLARDNVLGGEKILLTATGNEHTGVTMGLP